MIKKEQMIDIQDIYQNIKESLDEVLIGQEMAKELTTLALLSNPNSRLLFVGGTGYGKSTLSDFLRNSFKTERIFVTDELTVGEIQEQLKNETESMQCLQIEEFNRAKGKIQNTFIELFVNNQMTIGKSIYDFQDFYVFATQNNLDISGIFNISQAIYDRFDLCIYFEKLISDEKRALLFDYYKPLENIILPLEDIKYVQDIVNNFQYDEIDKDIIVEATDIIDRMPFKRQNLFEGSNVRGHFYAMRLAMLSAILYDRNYILPCDIARYVINLYMHRINQILTPIGSKEAYDAFDEAIGNILKLKRKDGKHE